MLFTPKWNQKCRHIKAHPDIIGKSWFWGVFSNAEKDEDDDYKPKLQSKIHLKFLYVICSIAYIIKIIESIYMVYILFLFFT